jgi:hypothetical protein
MNDPHTDSFDQAVRCNGLPGSRLSNFVAAKSILWQSAIHQ